MARKKYSILYVLLGLYLLAACGDDTPPEAGPLFPQVGIVQIGNIAINNMTEGETIFVKSGSVQVIVQASDQAGISSVTLSVNAGSLLNPTRSAGGRYFFDVDLTSVGNYTLMATAVNSINLKKETIRDVSIDNLPPTASIKITPSVGAEVTDPETPVVVPDKSSVTITITANDDVAAVGDRRGSASTVINLAKDGVLLEAAQRVLRTSLSNITSRSTFEVYVSDAAGNMMETRSFTITSQAVEEVDGAPSARIDIGEISGAITDDNCRVQGGNLEQFCFAGTISVPVTVSDTTNTAVVKVILNEQKDGDTIQRVVADNLVAPYVFQLNTLEFSNQRQYTFTTSVSSSAGSGTTRESDVFTIYNASPPPVVSIASPSDGALVSGLQTVAVSIDELTGSDFTLDLNGDNVIEGDSGEGIFVDLVFNNKIIGQKIIDGVPVSPTESGVYQTPEPFVLSDFASDIYQFRVSVPFRRNDTSPGEGTIDLNIQRVINVTIQESSQNPPALLILSPTNPVVTEDATNDRLLDVEMRDSTNSLVAVKATDNTGLSLIELRVFTGNPSDDNTPARFSYSAQDAFDVEVALPINYNATPYIPNTPDHTEKGTNYIVRIVAEDGEGNRRQEDLEVDITRGPDINFDLRFVDDLLNDSSQLGTPCDTRRRTISSGVVNIPFFLMMTLDGVCYNLDERSPPSHFDGTHPLSNIWQQLVYDHFYKGPEDRVYRLIELDTRTTEFPLSFSSPGIYTFVTQIRLPQQTGIQIDGSLYNNVVYSTSERKFALASE